MEAARVAEARRPEAAVAGAVVRAARYRSATTTHRQAEAATKATKRASASCAVRVLPPSAPPAVRRRTERWHRALPGSPIWSARGCRRRRTCSRDRAPSGILPEYAPERCRGYWRRGSVAVPPVAADWHPSPAGAAPTRLARQPSARSRRGRARATRCSRAVRHLLPWGGPVPMRPSPRGADVERQTVPDRHGTPDG